MIDFSPTPEQEQIRRLTTQIMERYVYPAEGHLSDGPEPAFFPGIPDAVLVRGLIALLLRIYSGRTPEDIIATSPKFFEEIELGSHLTGSRANGLHAMVKRIQATAREAQARAH